MSATAVPFYFGVGSRYSYLAATQLEAIEQRTGCRFEWLPMDSAELIRRANGGTSPFAGTAPSGQYDWTFRRRDAEAWAKYYGVPYQEPEQPTLESSDLAKACWIAIETGTLKDMCWQLFRAKFAEPKDLSRDGIGKLATEIGLDAEALLARLDLFGRAVPGLTRAHDVVEPGFGHAPHEPGCGRWQRCDPLRLDLRCFGRLLQHHGRHARRRQRLGGRR